MKRVVVSWLLIAFVAGCGGVAPELGHTRSELTLAELAARNGCSTAGTEGVNAQLIDELFCLTNGQLAKFTPRTGIVLATSRVHPYLSPAGRDRLWTAARSGAITIASALRTLAQQYLLWRNCPVAADPGRSNHETGRAIDVSNYGSVGAALVRAGFTHPLPSSDPVHYEAPGNDLRRSSVIAFQNLWNANHPNDRIAVDGDAGPQTLLRLSRTPGEGFTIGRVCGVMPEPQLRAVFVRQSYPDAAQGALELPAGTTRAAWLELRNTGTTTWVPGTTFLATTEPRGRTSALREPSWPSASRAATVDARTPPGETARFTFTLRAPDSQGHYLEHFGLFHQGIGWAGDAAQGGPADDRLKLRVRVGPPPYAATLVSTTFAELSVARPGRVLSGVFSLRNTGASTWRPGEVFLATTEPRERPSRFAHASWISPARVATPEVAVPPGEVWRATVRLQVPSRALGLIDERFGLVRAGVSWFGDDEQGGPDDDALFVRGFTFAGPTGQQTLPSPTLGRDPIPIPTGPGSPPTDTPPTDVPPAAAPQGGCSSAGAFPSGAGWLCLLGGLWLGLRRRRRRDYFL